MWKFQRGTKLCNMLGAGYYLLDVAQYETESSEEEKSRPTITVATQTSAEPEEQLVPVAVTPIQKKSKTKSVA